MEPIYSLGKLIYDNFKYRFLIQMHSYKTNIDLITSVIMTIFRYICTLNLKFY